MWNKPYNTTMLTVELREIVENGVELWNFDYPSYYKGEEKTAFEKKVIDHYYFRQIGQETVGRFLHCFRSRIREIMPRYIEMYKTVELMRDLDNPFDNVDIVETYEETASGTSKTDSTASGTASSESSASGTSTDTKNSTEDKEHRFSNTPQGSIANLNNYMTEAAVDDNSYTESVDTSSSSSATGTSENSQTSGSESESTSTVTHTLTKKGNQGVNTYAHDIIEFRQSIIDVDMMIIADLNNLFLGVY